MPSWLRQRLPTGAMQRLPSRHADLSESKTSHHIDFLPFSHRILQAFTRMPTSAQGDHPPPAANARFLQIARRVHARPP